MAHVQIYIEKSEIQNKKNTNLIDIGNSASSSYKTYKQIGIQAKPHTKFKLIDNKDQINFVELGKTGIFELNLTDINDYGIKQIILIEYPENPSFILIDLIESEEK